MALAEYDFLDATALAALVRQGEVTALELCDEAISRIERDNPALNAVVVKLFDEARQAARGPLPDGPFRGVPFLIKELDLAVAGAPLTYGSHFCRDVRADHDSTLVKRHRAAGLVIVGKTNSPEVGLVPFTEPKLWGPCHTPFRPGYGSGGSSGGAGAAVSARWVPMAHASDGGGSIRIPASCCGVFGLKPSRGRTAMGPDRSESWGGLVVHHAITRSVRDSAALLDATSAVDPDATAQAAPPVRSFLSETATPPGALRIALSKRLPMPGSLAPDCAQAVDAAAALCAELGHHVEEADLEIDPVAFASDFFLIVCVETAATLADLSQLIGRPATRADFETGTWLVGMLGRRHTAVAASRARERLQAIARKVVRFFERFDVLLTPTLGLPPQPIGALMPAGAEAMAQEVIASLGLGFVLALPPVLRATINRVFSFMPFTPLANITGQPSMSVPLHWNADGLPIGSMFTGRGGDEGTLFRLAAQLETARPWARRRPAPAA